MMVFLTMVQILEYCKYIRRVDGFCRDGSEKVYLQVFRWKRYVYRYICYIVFFRFQLREYGDFIMIINGDFVCIEVSGEVYFKYFVDYVVFSYLDT